MVPSEPLGPTQREIAHPWYPSSTLHQPTQNTIYREGSHSQVYVKTTFPLPLSGDFFSSKLAISSFNGCLCSY